MSNQEWFQNIGQHWAHFLEVDIPVDAPNIQVIAMKKAFAAGAISGLQLACLAGRNTDEAAVMRDIQKHVAGIKALGGCNE